MRKKIMILTVALVLLSFGAPALAQNRGGAVTLSPFAGGYMFDCFQHLDNNWYYGLRVGYNFTDHWGSEAMFGYVPTESDAYGYKGEDVDVYRYGIDVLYHFWPENKFVPFIAVGYGDIEINDPSGLNDHHRGMFDYGGGVKYFITENVALRADVRHDLFCEFDEVCNNFEYTGGVTFLFGGHSGPAAAAYTPPPATAPVVLIELDDTHFAHDSAALTPQGKAVLDENIRTLKANPKLRFLVAGYTSASGSDEYNQELSERRASAVKDYLITEGDIDPDRLEQIGYGEDRPAEYEAYPEDIESRAAQANRRVLFTIIVE